MSEAIDNKTREIAAIAASIACGCEPCLKYHFNAAKKAGASLEEMREAVEIALMVKSTPLKTIEDLAIKLGLLK